MGKKVTLRKKYIKNFEKRIKPNKNLVEKYKDRLNDFLKDKDQEHLRDHALKGNMLGFREFHISGDIVLVYTEQDDNYLFYDIGSHNQIFN